MKGLRYMSVKIYSSAAGKMVKLSAYTKLKAEVETYREAAELFDYWIKMASLKPIRVALAIAKCITPEEYRTALTALMNEDKK